MLDSKTITKAPIPDDDCHQCKLVNLCTHPHSLDACPNQPSNIARQTLPLKRKEVLYSYHDPFQCVYVIHAGAIKTFQIDIHGQERIQHFYLPGEIIGLEAIETGSYPYTAIALTQTIVCEIPFENLMTTIAGRSQLQKSFVVSLAERINQGQYVNAPAAEQRLAAFLLDMRKRMHQDAQHEIELPMSRYDIGNYLGLAPETISRIFTRFQQAKLVHVQNKKVSLTNMASLQWIAQDGVSCIEKSV